MDKRLEEHLNAWVPHVHGVLRCEMALLTIQYDPNRISTAQGAWQEILKLEKTEVLKLEKTVVDILAMEEDILYLVSTAEMHWKKEEKQERGGARRGDIECEDKRRRGGGIQEV
ncbi:Hypothetical protein HVR_LOCUS684 [uncultured virus]|nr:Hypothetical protein HVR_LOCUS684 [uncultured virus]